MFSSGHSSPKINTARMLLAELRGGDYAHAGDREAVHMVAEKAIQLSPDIQKGRTLDVGSGYGGTANDFYHLGFKKIWGIDMDVAAVHYATMKYPEIKFFAAEANEIPNLFEPHFFSFIYLFNVFYAIEDKLTLLKKLSIVAEKGAILTLFDYTAEEKSLSMKDLAGKPMYPIILSEIKEDLKKSGWEVLEVVDLSNEYLFWYQSLLDKLAEERGRLTQKFSEADIVRVENTFTLLRSWLENMTLGGVVIYAKKA